MTSIITVSRNLGNTISNISSTGKLASVAASASGQTTLNPLTYAYANKGLMFFGRLSVRPLTFILRDG